MTTMPPICPHCQQPMQLWQDKPELKSYVCGCQNPPHYITVHAGQGGKQP